MTSKQRPFWETKTLEAMTPEEWESLCDRCGQCCLHKIEDNASGKVVYTAIACQLLDMETCRCSDYENRFARVEECLKIDPLDVKRMQLLPETCAYRRLSEGKPLPDWHHLISNDPDAVHRADVSVRGKVFSEEHVHPEDFEHFLTKY